ncbi:MAG: YgiQ family radical SAM protein [Bacillota bacterium]|jgi:uncharacterized radical SAM protein YgiQ
MLLPINKQEMLARDWHYVDFVLVSGDAYVDHSSFAPALIGRYLQSLGYRIAILPQPDWRKDDDWLELGRPRLAFLVTSGNLDSLLAHYTAAKKKRRQDLYSPGGKRKRPDYATTVYSHKLRSLYADVPIILGGLEASLRRFAHYDYWRNEVLPSVLLAADADLLVYGMGELALTEIARRLQKSGRIEDCYDIPGVAYHQSAETPLPADALSLPSFDEVKKSKKAFARAFATEYREQNFYDGKTLVQRHEGRNLVVNRPMRPLTQEELDAVYELPFERIWHPSYDKLGGVPAFDEVRFSLLSHRGCFGGCSFCSLNFHQGSVIQSRSARSIIEEAKLLTKLPGFKGYIHDVGGPTANFRGQVCKKASQYGPCRDKECMYPRVCSHLPKDSSEYEQLLTELRRLPGVKKVFVRSGLRFDYAMAEKSRSFLHNLCRYHISGQLKVAPEHMAATTLAAMGKSPAKVYLQFKKEYEEINKKIKRKQFLVPYFMSSHPGTGLEEAIVLASHIKKSGVEPEQVQEFIPTPGTLSTCMYYTGLDPRTMRPVYVPKSDEERAMQRALLNFSRPENRANVIKALRQAKRQDLIGQAHHCLIADLDDAASRPKHKSHHKIQDKRQDRLEHKRSDNKVGPRCCPYSGQPHVESNNKSHDKNKQKRNYDKKR